MDAQVYLSPWLDLLAPNSSQCPKFARQVANPVSTELAIIPNPSLSTRVGSVSESSAS
ncbi:hypothetical protein MED222_05020 [Vibrio sp. MED222]|nr:hypothetical protein MED222_05020 [Vibrio sp. MED222]